MIKHPSDRAERRRISELKSKRPRIKLEDKERSNDLMEPAIDETTTTQE